VLSGRYACYGTYRAGDGRYLAVGAIEAKFFANLCRALGCEEWIASQYDDEAQPRIRAALAEAFARRQRDDWVAELAGADTCVAPVLEVEEVVSDPAALARGALSEAHHPEHGVMRQLAPLLAGMRRAPEPVALPGAGTDTMELLAAAGMAESQVSELVAAGVVA
jgi:alpha-methylacyl-CoA racemase